MQQQTLLNTQIKTQFFRNFWEGKLMVVLDSYDQLIICLKALGGLQYQVSLPNSCHFHNNFSEGIFKKWKKNMSGRTSKVPSTYTPLPAQGGHSLQPLLSRKPLAQLFWLLLDLWSSSKQKFACKKKVIVQQKTTTMREQTLLPCCKNCFTYCRHLFVRLVRSWNNTALPGYCWQQSCVHWNWMKRNWYGEIMKSRCILIIIFTTIITTG